MSDRDRTAVEDGPAWARGPTTPERLALEPTQAERLADRGTADRGSGGSDGATGGGIGSDSPPSGSPPHPGGTPGPGTVTVGGGVTGDAVAAAAAQRDFDRYAATPEGAALLEREGDVYTRASTTPDGVTIIAPLGSDDAQSARQRLFVARVRFLREEGGFELFDEFTPDRAALSGQALLEHDRQILRILPEIHGQGVLRTGSGLFDVASKDASLSYLIASGLVEAFGSSDAQLDDIMRDVNDGWHVNAADRSVGGRYQIERSLLGGRDKWIRFGLDSLVRSYVDPNDRFDLIAHEAAHAIDGNGVNRIDGLPSVMPADQARILASERDRLFALHAANGERSGLAEYAFTNREEFWAEISEYFLSGDDGAAQILLASPKLYDVLRTFYERTDLPSAAAHPLSPLPDHPPREFGDL